MGASNAAVSYLKRAEKQGGKFLNPVPTDVGGVRIVFKVLPQYVNNRAQVEPKRPLGPFTTDASVYTTEPKSGLRVTWFGHSASLIEIDGMRVLVDPVWERASPFSFMGPKRFFEPTIALDALPKIDVVLISHDHYDHLGAETVRQLAKGTATAGARWVTSLGVGKRLRGFGVPTERITQLDWTESVEVGGLKVTSWPARHFSGRGLFDRFKTLWGSFVIEGPRHRVYFGADSGWWEGYGEIAAQYDGFDLAMLEIGAFHPLWDSIHLGPDNAAKAFEVMSPRGGLMMPIHWGLFNLALHAWKQPVERMLEVADEKGIKLWLPEPGAPTDVVAELRSGWWERAE
ncbi:MAG TPA: MBL fold metallo-hydrolase [Acidobacteriaceae bacterium]|nr:MBL fold metallo-hydrolase [Acidobacteriaceae bacterium]